MASGLSNSGDSVTASDLPRSFYWFLAIAGAALLISPAPQVQYAVFAVICVIYFTCYLYSPDRTLLIFIIMLPVESLLPAGLRLLPGVNFDTIIFLSLVAATMMSRGLQVKPVPRNPLFAPFLYFTAVLTMAGVVSVLTGNAQSHSFEQGWEQIGPYHIFSQLKNVVFFLFLAPIAFRLMWTRKHVSTAATLVAWATIFVSLQAIWLMWDQILAGRIGGADRAVSFMLDSPNSLGGFLALMLCVFFPIVLSPVGSKKRTLFGIAVALTGVALLLTFSRGAWLGALVGLLYLGLTRGAKLAAVLLVLALTAATWIPETVFERVQNTFREDQTPFGEGIELEGSAQGRINQWKSVPGIWIEAPLLGHGYLTFGSLYGTITKGGAARSAHSSIIKIIVETGLAGLIAYCWILWTLGRSVRRVGRHSDDVFLRALSSGFIAALICLMVLDCSGKRFHSNTVMPYFWILGGALARMSQDLADNSGMPTVSEARYPERRRIRSHMTSHRRIAASRRCDRGDPSVHQSRMEFPRSATSLTGWARSLFTL